jgi:MFS family permease
LVPDIPLRWLAPARAVAHSTHPAVGCTLPGLSDAEGRIRILLIAFAIGFLGLVTLYFAHSSAPLVIGVALVATYFAILAPLTMALVGDVTTSKNLEYLTSFFVTVQVVGILSALVLSALIQTKTVYLISMGALGVALVVLLPVIRVGLQPIRERIAHEVV